MDSERCAIFLGFDHQTSTILQKHPRHTHMIDDNIHHANVAKNQIVAIITTRHPLKASNNPLEDSLRCFDISPNKFSAPEPKN
jgi:hypothetical protein